MKTIVLTGGGTAGHVMPNVALLPSLRKHFDRIVYIGESGGVEQRIMAAHPDVIFHGITCVKLRRSLTPKNLAIPFKLIRGIRQARAILRDIKPTVVFSKGGFVAYPAVRAAAKLGIPVIAHESDMTMGLANRMSLRHAHTVCTTFPSTKVKHPRVIHTGTPIRAEIFTGNPSAVNVPHNGKTKLLVMGGSLGATAINNALHAALPTLTQTHQIIHITGSGKLTTNHCSLPTTHYTQLEFATNIADYLAWADVVISRCGSNALCELMALGKPTLFIPLPTGRGDQLHNAREVLAHNAAGVLWQQYLTPETLAKGLTQLDEHRDTYTKNARVFTNTDAVDKIVALIRQLLQHI